MAIKLSNKFLKNIDPLNIKYPGTNLTYEQVLRKETERLKGLLEYYLERYYDSYTPVHYIRGAYGGNLKSALSVDNVCKISASKGKITIDININDDAIHNSIVTGKPANAYWLLNDGWTVKKKVWFKDIYRFGHYEGAHFVEEAVEEFIKTSKYGIKVEIIRPLKYYQ